MNTEAVHDVHIIGNERLNGMNRDNGVVAVEDLSEGEPVAAVTPQGEQVCLVNSGGEIHAVSNVCTHQEFEMALGDVRGDTITCAWHGARFDLRTGAVLEGPATEPLPVYDVAVRDGRVFVGGLKEPP